MTDKGGQNARQSAKIVQGVLKKTALLILVSVGVAVLLQRIVWPEIAIWSIPAGIVFGGALGVLNFRWLAYSVERVYLHKNSTSLLSNIAAAVITILKLSVIFIVLYIVIQWKVLHLVGLVAGLSLCFLAILWQGFGVMTADPRQDQ